MTSTIMDRNLVVESKNRDGIAISANGFTTFTLDVSKDGYVPLGTVGHANGVNTNFFAYSSVLSGNTLTIGLKSVNATAITVNYTVYVLYQKK